MFLSNILHLLINICQNTYVDFSLRQNQPLNICYVINNSFLTKHESIQNLPKKYKYRGLLHCRNDYRGAVAHIATWVKKNAIKDKKLNFLVNFE